MINATRPSIWVNQERLDRLEHELADLRGRVRDLIALRVAGVTAQEPGLGAAAALESQEQMEARIAQLESLLATAQVGPTPPDDGLVEPGMRITVRFDATSDTTTFLLGSRELLSDGSIDVYSPGSPLGEAINGKYRGDSVSYRSPNGSPILVTILDAVPN